MISAVEPCRRSRLCWPVDILLPLFGHTTINCITSQKMVLTNLRPLYPSIVGGDDRLFINIRLTVDSPTMPPQCHHDRNSPPINRHIPSNVSSVERWYSQSLVLLPPSFLLPFDQRRQRWWLLVHLHMYIAADRRLRWVYNRKDGTWLLAAIAYCSLASNSHVVESLYGTAGVQSSGRWYDV